MTWCGSGEEPLRDLVRRGLGMACSGQPERWEGAFRRVATELQCRKATRADVAKSQLRPTPTVRWEPWIVRAVRAWLRAHYQLAVAYKFTPARLHLELVNEATTPLCEDR